ncbi:MAG: aminotransferase class V-fold PLP-dependent enzyme [Bdellovibrionales bacterium]
MKRRAGTELRALFPQLARTVRGAALTYLDNAATTLKPKPVIEAVCWYYTNEVANIHRAAHFLGDEGTSHYEAVREKLKKFLNARFSEEIVFTKGTTEGLNLLASTLVPGRLKKGDQILLSEMEHHSNIVPWQMAAEKAGVEIKVVRVTDQGELDLEDLKRQLNGRVKILSLTHISNALGTVNPLSEIFKLARNQGVITVADAAQSVALGLVDVQQMNCDFLVFSGHKIFGPNGVGAVYGRKELFNELPPYQGGGSMISEVAFTGTTYLGLPHRFEAGTPAIAEVIGLGAALDFVSHFDHEQIRIHESELVAQVLEGLATLKGVRLIGTSPTRTNIVSFVMDGAHPSDVGQLLDQQGIAVRTGHHCCQPLMKRFGIPGTVRISFSAYNTLSEADAFLNALHKVKGLLQ